MKLKYTIKRMLLAAAATVFVFAFMLASAGAQELRGKITGHVLDPNGAAVPGATVKVVDVARNTTSTLTTNDQGIFDAPYLLPGSYQVMVEVSGFKKALQDNVQVAINQTTSLELKLDVGTPQETVTVTTEVELPSVHGDPYYLINLTPGVAYTVALASIVRLSRPISRILQWAVLAVFAATS
jgi:hypothetical protein